MNKKVRIRSNLKPYQQHKLSKKYPEVEELHHCDVIFRRNDAIIYRGAISSRVKLIWRKRSDLGPHKETEFGDVSTSGAVDHCSVGVAFPRHTLITTKHYFFGVQNVDYTPDFSFYLLVFAIIPSD